MNTGDNADDEEVFGFSESYFKIVPDCSQSLCLEIKNKRKSLDKLYNLVETLNTNNEDLDKCCGVSTDFISKLTGFFHNHW